MALSARQKGVITGGVIIAVILFILWWIFGRKTDKKELQSGERLYKQNGRYYLVTATKAKINIPQDEYQYLIAKDAGDCVKPPEGNPQRLRNPSTARMAGDRCNYYGYRGIVNDCGTCSLWRDSGGNVSAACGPMGQDAECVTGDSPLGQTTYNGFYDSGNLCTPCNQTPLY